MKPKVIGILMVVLSFSFSDLFAEDEKTPPQTVTQTVTQTQKLQVFRTVNFEGTGNLYLKQSDEESFTIEAEDSILPLIKVYVKEGVLYISLKDASKHTQNKINYYLSIKDIKNINSFDASTIFIQEPLKTSELTLSLGSLGNADININVQNLSLKIGGGSKVVARGSAQNQDISIIGAGEFNGEKLTGKNATLAIKESGIVKMNVSDKLAVNISGDGTVHYCGQPVITREVSGKAIIEPQNQCPVN